MEDHTPTGQANTDTEATQTTGTVASQTTYQQAPEERLSDIDVTAHIDADETPAVTDDELRIATAEAWIATLEQWSQTRSSDLAQLRTTIIQDDGTFGHCRIATDLLTPEDADRQFVPPLELDPGMDADLIGLAAEFAVDLGHEVTTMVER